MSESASRTSLPPCIWRLGLPFSGGRWRECERCCRQKHFVKPSRFLSFDLAALPALCVCVRGVRFDRTQRETLANAALWRVCLLQSTSDATQVCETTAPSLEWVTCSAARFGWPEWHPRPDPTRIVCRYSLTLCADPDHGPARPLHGGGKARPRARPRARQSHSPGQAPAGVPALGIEFQSRPKFCDLNVLANLSCSRLLQTWTVGLLPCPGLRTRCPLGLPLGAAWRGAVAALHPTSCFFGFGIRVGAVSPACPRTHAMHGEASAWLHSATPELRQSHLSQRAFPSTYAVLSASRIDGWASYRHLCSLTRLTQHAWAGRRCRGSALC